MTIRIQEELSVRGHFRYHDSIGLLSAAGPGFSGPYSIALGSDNLLYVANRANPNQPEAVRVTKCTKDGEYVDQFAEWGEGDGQYTWVNSIEFDRHDQLYLSDEHIQRISVFNVDGRFVRSFGEYGTGEGQWDRPTGITFDADNNLVVVDSLNHRVQKLTTRGQYLAQWGSYGSGDGQFNMPWGIAMDVAGNHYVTDWRNDRVQKFDAEGRFLMCFGGRGARDGQFNRPNGIAVDAQGDIYVCDWMNDRVQVFDPDGRFKDILIGHSGTSKWARDFLDANPDIEEKLDLATQNIEPKRRFFRPVSVKVDQDNAVYVADCYRHRVQIYQKLQDLDPG